MSLRPLPSRLIAAHARPDAFADNTVSILGRLGYRILAAEDLEALHREEEDREEEDREEEDREERERPDLLIVDERRLGEVEEEPGEPALPVILLTGRHGTNGADPRIVGAVKRPAGMHDLYRLLQQIFEDTPRATPRVPTHLSAVCRRNGQEWSASLLSVSENGCLLRSPEPLPLGGQLQLAFELPGRGELQVTAETAYQLVPDVGLVFSAVAPSVRQALGDYVARVLLPEAPESPSAMEMATG